MKSEKQFPRRVQVRLTESQYTFLKTVSKEERVGLACVIRKMLEDLERKKGRLNLLKERQALLNLDKAINYQQFPE